jgi:starch phosphorylase
MDRNLQPRRGHDEINRRSLHAVPSSFHGDEARTAHMSLIGKMPVKQVRMAHVANVDSHSTNVAAAMHSELLRTGVVKDFGNML